MSAIARARAWKQEAADLYTDARTAGARVDLAFAIAWLALMVFNLSQGEWTNAALEFCLALTYLRVVGLTVLVDMYRSLAVDLSR